MLFYVFLFCLYLGTGEAAAPGSSAAAANAPGAGETASVPEAPEV